VTAEVFISCKCMQHSFLELSRLPLVKHLRSDVQNSTDLFVIISSFYVMGRFIRTSHFWMSVDADACVVVWTAKLKVLFKCEALTCVQPAYLHKLKIFAKQGCYFWRNINSCNENDTHFIKVGRVIWHSFNSACRNNFNYFLTGRCKGRHHILCKNSVVS